MKKRIFYIVVVAVFAFVFQNVEAKILRFGPTAGMSTVTGADIYTKDLKDGGFGFDTENYFGGKAKLGLPLFPFTITGQAHYVSYKGEGIDYAAIPPYASMLTEGDGERKFSLLTMSLGLEKRLLPGPLSPYLAADFLISSFGDAESTIRYPGGSTTIKSDGESRYGLGIGAGLDFTLLPTIDVDVSAKYNFNSLFGKEDDEENFNTFNISVSVMFGIL